MIARTERTSSDGDQGVFAAFRWGAFLGTSWTWVIGMLLPALLIRDMGGVGFLAFALPNCIGDAAMGTVLSMQSARNLLVNHRGMVLTFSVVTVAYHFYIAGFLLPNLLGPLALVVFGLSCVVALVTKIKWEDRGTHLYSIAIWIISMICFLVSIGAPGAFSIYEGRPLLDPSYKWFFLPASISGFLLCPYLDATFIRARANTKGKTGVWAFIIGFFIIFAPMIIFTTSYGHELLGSFSGEDSRLSGIWWVLLCIHIPLQMGLTVIWHSREIYSMVPNRNIELKYKTVLNCTLLFLGVFFLGLYFKDLSLSWFNEFKSSNIIETLSQAFEIGRIMSIGEIGYRCLLIFYGTLFPAYVLIMMLPNLSRVKVSKHGGFL